MEEAPVMTEEQKEKESVRITEHMVKMVQIRALQARKRLRMETHVEDTCKNLYEKRKHILQKYNEVSKN